MVVCDLLRQNLQTGSGIGSIGATSVLESGAMSGAMIHFRLITVFGLLLGLMVAVSARAASTAPERTQRSTHAR